MSIAIVRSSSTVAELRSASGTGPLILTWARLPLGLLIAWSALTGRSSLGILTLLTFVLVDVFDGVWARTRRHEDFALRRGVDSIVDRLSISMAFVAATAVNALFAPVAIGFLAISVVSLPIAWRTWGRHRIVLRAPRWHRWWSTCAAVAGLCLFVGLTSASVVMAYLSLLAALLCTLQVVAYHLTLRVPSRG